jgi:hypothetical protein
MNTRQHFMQKHPLRDERALQVCSARFRDDDVRFCPCLTTVQTFRPDVWRDRSILLSGVEVYSGAGCNTAFAYRKCSIAPHARRRAGKSVVHPLVLV